MTIPDAYYVSYTGVRITKGSTYDAHLGQVSDRLLPQPATNATEADTVRDFAATLREEAAFYGQLQDGEWPFSNGSASRDAECGVTLAHVGSHAPSRGGRLGTLPPRLALETEDSIWAAAERSGYDPAAVERAFHAKFWAAGPELTERERALQPTRELDDCIEL